MPILWRNFTPLRVLIEFRAFAIGRLRGSATVEAGKRYDVSLISFQLGNLDAALHTTNPRGRTPVCIVGV